MSIEEAISLQRSLAPMVSSSSGVPEKLRHVAGVDISPPDREGSVLGAVVVLGYPRLEVEEVSTAQGKPGLPYVPGLLSFRETPVLTKALERLEISPDVIIVDGHGLAHPRRFGIACHIGLITDTPTIGCAKSILRGRHGFLDREAGSQAELVDKADVVGIALRTRTDISPVYLTIGHKIDLATAVKTVLACCNGRRLPETTRLAHLAAAGRLPRRSPAPAVSALGHVFDRHVPMELDRPRQPGQCRLL